ncbi:MAG TPA: WHG domain-containing protein [Nocardioidaceae bacterium]|nr:WHG domain-containing protein [Nocardioidaceae bacterium]
MPAPSRTSIAEIVSAGRDLLESGGPAALTMQKVAQKVGVRAPSLYKHVRDREALLSAVSAATIDDLAECFAGSEESLDSLFRAYRAFAHRWPEGFRLMFSPGAPLDSLERASEPVLAAARDLAGAEALEAARLMTAWATGFIHMELAGAFRLGGDVDHAFEYGLEHLRAGLER